MLTPITAAKWAEWCAQPGMDSFGHPWSSWDHIILTDHQTEQIAIQARMMRAEHERMMSKQKRQQKRQQVPTEAASTQQLELGL